MALTMAKLALMIAEKNGFAKNKSVEFVENLIEIIKRTLEGPTPTFALPGATWT